MSQTLTADVEHVDHEHHETATGISNEKLAMWVFLASDCLLFGGLISTYLLYKNRPGGIPGTNIEDRISEGFDIVFTSMTSFILLMSSLTMVLAVTAIKRGDHQRTRLWLGTTAVFGSLFMGGQIYEFTVFAKEGFGFTSGVSTTSFYTLTGFHGAHVTIGIIMLLSCLMLSLRGRLPQSRAESVEVVGLYWHFVDIVWVIIFTIVYLIP